MDTSTIIAIFLSLIISIGFGFIWGAKEMVQAQVKDCKKCKNGGVK